MSLIGTLIFQNILNEKDVVLQSKVDKIESLNKVIMQKNKSHLETVEVLKKRNMENINEERSRCTQKINKIAEESADLQNKFVENYISYYN